MKTGVRAYNRTVDKGRGSDSIERRAMRQSIGAVIDVLMVQPNWCAADSALFVKLGDAIANFERGHTASWLSNKPSHRVPTPINIRRRQAQAAAHMEQLMRRGLSRKMQRQGCFGKFPLAALLFEKEENDAWRSVARWLDEIKASPRSCLERKSFEEALKQRECLAQHRADRCDGILL
jgi:hypothetical protein